ncbi:MAG TPA: DUF6607 family protein, partial [Myxococcota bacterium]|nr:DUF6607 family protein [Myxococcota bacterium]
MKLSLISLSASWLMGASSPPAEPEAQSRGRAAIERMSGCYLVDYSFVEDEALKAGYGLDRRVYDVNRHKSIKEWIEAERLAPDRVWLQHVMFATDREGHLVEGTELKHTSEDWRYGAPSLYELAEPGTWGVRDLRDLPTAWTRRIAHLDDGLRYACAAPWDFSHEYAEWGCDAYAPIPGRESRDMDRHDYNALERRTHLVLYGATWLERQSNVKTVDDKQGHRQPLAHEVGKTWYVRLPDAECAPARAFAAPRRAFWALLRDTWDAVLDGGAPFLERTPAGAPSRFVKMDEIEEEALRQDLRDA